MSKCKYCGIEIAWLQGSDGRNRPVNMDGSPHNCNRAPPTPAGGSIPDRTQQRILWCWAVGQAVQVCDCISWQERAPGIMDPEEKLRWIKSVAEHLVRFVESKTT